MRGREDDFQRDIRNLPNILSMVRIAVIPLVLVLLSWDHPFLNAAAAGLYALGTVTDMADGYLARAMNKTTTLGKLLDPLADKLLVIACLIMLVDLDRVPAITVVLILSRDFLVTGVRGIASAAGQILPASGWGKLKASSFNISIFCLILGHNYQVGDTPFQFYGLIFLYLGLFFSLWSAYLYLRVFYYETLRQKRG
ncbi:MAG: CDP-diacylglycerol--glycerol-3-phosphate 3-phosphatidyltransferase [Deltaproteobacteria bacterium RIFOXYA12_FULL_61_11]|nr:MAG: CDP-diacylglycerol--glycerol-3-phosphate 3-phosphatidyltransferase [Deltaproteobacteria bacterium RIFOXYA12_FULL_61_11]